MDTKGKTGRGLYLLMSLKTLAAQLKRPCLRLGVSKKMWIVNKKVTKKELVVIVI
jgi:hypothetical protein